jgi:hypothetical protein
MDVSAADAAGKGPFDYAPIFTKHESHPAYYRAVTNFYPLVSTFGDGGLMNQDWSDWKSTVMKNKVYFVPNLDHTSGYHQGASSWWIYWEAVVDGLFSWESAWPEPASLSGTSPSDVALDVAVISGTREHGKSYMMRKFASPDSWSTH